MQKIEICLKGEKSKDYESCENCIYYDLPVASCVAMKCVHAIAYLEECYIPKGAKEDAESR